MAGVEVIKTLDELRRFLNEKGILEIAVRGKNKKFKAFYKIALDQVQQNEVAEKVQNAAKLLVKNNNIAEKSLDILNGVSKLNKLNLVLNGANLCATCAGFAIMYAKLDKLSAQISEVVAVYKQGQVIHTTFEFNKILSEHSNMLDCRKKQNYYSEDQMRELVDGEYNVLTLLIDSFLAEITSNREDLLFSILSLTQMLSVSLRYFDELYYFENKDSIENGDKWHMSHDKWLAVFDRLTSIDFISTIQDYGIFEMDLNTEENDCFYINFNDQIKSLKQDVEDNQKLILAIDDKELFSAVMNKSNEEIQTEIEEALEEAGVPAEVCDNLNLWELK